MSGHTIVILGGGESGVGAALLAKAKGFAVFLSDGGMLKDQYRSELQAAGIEFEEGQHTEERVLAASEVIKSPGIPVTAPLIQKLRTQGTPVISEIEFAARYTTAKLIGITGSNGKTTTALLTYHLLKSAGLNVGLAGNIGDSFAKQVIENTVDYYVLELSSFQLDDMFETHLNIRVLLNITPDHLDRYEYSFQNYIDSKFRILQNAQPDDTFIYFAESEPIQAELAKRHPIATLLPISLKTTVRQGGYLTDGILIANCNTHSFSISQTDTPLRGPHNAINMLTAILVAQSVEVSDEAIANGLKTFHNAPHRLEPVGTIRNVQFINDSKATNVDSVFYALSSIDAPIIWIAGGQDKGNNYSQLDDLVRQHVKALICLGVDNQKLVDYFGKTVSPVYETQQIRDAVTKAFAWAQPGDVVLLSPACASFDLFKNYEDRGNQFKESVQNLMMNDER